MKWRYPILVVPSLQVNGMALFPFVLVQKEASKYDEVIVRHEKIHLKQQLEMLVLPFYFFYLINYLVNRLRSYDHDKAYRNIVFEQEAYANDASEDYLKKRKPFSWVRYFKHRP